MFTYRIDLFDLPLERLSELKAKKLAGALAGGDVGDRKSMLARAPALQSSADASGGQHDMSNMSEIEENECRHKNIVSQINSSALCSLRLLLSATAITTKCGDDVGGKYGWT